MGEIRIHTPDLTVVRIELIQLENLRKIPGMWQVLCKVILLLSKCFKWSVVIAFKEFTFWIYVFASWIGRKKEGWCLVVSSMRFHYMRIYSIHAMWEEGFDMIINLSLLLPKHFRCSSPPSAQKQCLSLITAMAQPTNRHSTGCSRLFFWG